MTTTGTRANRTELAHRASNGIEVYLLWDRLDDSLVVSVSDDLGEPFELRVDPGEALDVFHHPFAYAAFRSSHATLDLAA